MAKLMDGVVFTDPLRIVATIGIPGCGKSTWADKFLAENHKFIQTERDLIRAWEFTESGNRWDYKYTGAREKQVTAMQGEDIRQALMNGKSVVISDTNLNPKTRSHLQSIATEFGIEIEWVPFDVPLHQAVKQNLRRPEHVPESVLINMERNMRQYLGKYVQTPEGRMWEQDYLPSCVLVDIDGTLADMKGIRSPFEWDKVHLDKPRQFVVDYVKYLWNWTDHKIIIFSGRDGSCEELTRRWLLEHGIHHHELHMRPEGSQINDSILKENLFNQHILGKYTIDHIVDDRKQVAIHWESMGFQIMNVGGFLADF